MIICGRPASCCDDARAHLRLSAREAHLGACLVGRPHACPRTTGDRQQIGWPQTSGSIDLPISYQCKVGRQAGGLFRTNPRESAELANIRLLQHDTRVDPWQVVAGRTAGQLRPFVPAGAVWQASRPCRVVGTCVKATLFIGLIIHSPVPHRRPAATRPAYQITLCRQIGFAVIRTTAPSSAGLRTAPV